MMKRLLSLVSILLALGVSTVAFADEKPKSDEKPKIDKKLAAVEKELAKVWEKLESMTADMAMDMTMQGMSSKSKGTIEFSNKSDKELFRMEIKSEQNMGGQKMETIVSTIYDGEFLYSVSDMMGQKMAVKQKSPTTSRNPGGKRMFEKLKKENELKILPDEKVDGKDTFVLEAVPNTKGQNPVAKMKMFFVKDNGIMVKMLGFDTGGNQMMTITYSNIKINPKIDPARFVFKAPDGVQVMDMTNQ